MTSTTSTTSTTSKTSKTSITSSDFTVAYSTVYWNHYQAAICRELARALGPSRFKMCVIEPPDQERRELKWDLVPDALDWVIPPAQTQAERDHVAKVVCDADVAIMGSLPIERAWYRFRASSKRLTFCQAERGFKQPLQLSRLINPRYAHAIWNFHKTRYNRNLHLLAIGDYGAADARSVGAFGNRIWRWAYFTDIPDQPPTPRGKNRLKLLWAGRLIGWKQVDTLLRAVSHLKDGEVEELRIVGVGPDEAKLKQLANDLGLSTICRFQGAVPPAEVANLMRQADVFVLPSSRMEGWGVVATEAMSQGSLLVADREVGSVPNLIRDGETGFLFDDRSDVQLADILHRLASDTSTQDRVRLSAWQHLSSLWNPRVGATRLVSLMAGLLQTAPMPVFDDGPCQRYDPA